MRIDAARHDELAAGIDDPRAARRREIGADFPDKAAVAQDVRAESPVCAVTTVPPRIKVVAISRLLPLVGARSGHADQSVKNTEIGGES
jgi:hypothetical protein